MSTAASGCPPIPKTDQNAQYWFKVPDLLSLLVNLRPAELKCFLVILQAIQRDENGGRISERQVAVRAKLGLRHVNAALASLVERGLIERECQGGSTAEYYLPFTWRGEQKNSKDSPNCFPTGIQSDPPNRIPTGKQFPEDCSPRGKRNCIPVGEQNCFPTGIQHLESLEHTEHTLQDSSALREAGTAAAGSAPSGSPIDPIPRMQFGGFPCGGWETSEDFETWWKGVVAGHRNKHLNGAARSKALELVLTGQLTRIEFERGYAALVVAKAERWTEQGGRFVTNLAQILEDGLWRFTPAKPPAGDYQSGADYWERLKSE